MAKKSLGKFLAFATISGAVAAGISYFLKYKSFNKELDKDFHDFEGDGEDDFDGSLPHESEDSKRTYVTIGEKKSPAAAPAQDTVKEDLETATDGAAQACEMAKDRVVPATETFKDESSSVWEDVKDGVAKAQEVAEAVKENADTTIIEEDLSI